MLTQIRTPWQLVEGTWVKRDDLFELNGSRGGKVRTCLALATRAGVRGLVTAGSRQSPQVNIVATVAEHLGLPCEVHVPAANKPFTPELENARDRGARVVEHRPGHNSVIVSRARRAAEALGWTEIPFGMECEEAVHQTASQVQDIPPDVERIVMPVGSGMSLAGVFAGLQLLGSDLPILGVVVGASPEKRLYRYAPMWRFGDVELVNAGLDYHASAPVTRLGDLPLDPIYEAKCLPFLRAGDALWVVGRRESAN